MVCLPVVFKNSVAKDQSLRMICLIIAVVSYLNWYISKSNSLCIKVYCDFNYDLHTLFSMLQIKITLFSFVYIPNFNVICNVSLLVVF